MTSWSMFDVGCCCGEVCDVFDDLDTFDEFNADRWRRSKSGSLPLPTAQNGQLYMPFGKTSFFDPTPFSQVLADADCPDNLPLLPWSVGTLFRVSVTLTNFSTFNDGPSIYQARPTFAIGRPGTQLTLVGVGFTANPTNHLLWAPGFTTTIANDPEPGQRMEIEIEQLTSGTAEIRWRLNGVIVQGRNITTFGATAGMQFLLHVNTQDSLPGTGFARWDDWSWEIIEP